MNNFFIGIFNIIVELLPIRCLKNLLYLKFYRRKKEKDKYTEYLRNMLKNYSTHYMNNVIIFDLHYFFFLQWADAKLIYRAPLIPLSNVKTIIYSKQSFAMYNSYCRFVNISLKAKYSRTTFLKEGIQMELDISENEFLELEKNNKQFLVNHYPELYEATNGVEVRVQPVDFDQFGVYMKIFKQNYKNNSTLIWQHDELYLSNFELLDKD